MDRQEVHVGLVWGAGGHLSGDVTKLVGVGSERIWLEMGFGLTTLEWQPSGWVGGVTQGTACHAPWEGVEGQTPEATALRAQRTESWTQSRDGEPCSQGSSDQEAGGEG